MKDRIFEGTYLPQSSDENIESTTFQQSNNPNLQLTDELVNIFSPFSGQMTTVN